MDAGRSPERVDFETGIIGQRTQPGRRRCMPRLLHGVGQKSRAGFSSAGNPELVLADQRERQSRE